MSGWWIGVFTRENRGPTCQYFDSSPYLLGFQVHTVAFENEMGSLNTIFKKRENELLREARKTFCSSVVTIKD